MLDATMFSDELEIDNTRGARRTIRILDRDDLVQPEKKTDGRTFNNQEPSRGDNDGQGTGKSAHRPSSRGR
ncbi:hypothetical protein MPER_02575 [Moniliophthora perniciosa FA553]|nr:hypothetical protein MPER_02575 [Moniliophthora perniciosa FA553]